MKFIGHAHSYTSVKLVVASIFASVTVKNCLADINGGTGSIVCYGTVVSGTFHANSTNNLASDTTAPGSNPVNSTTPTYVNAGGRDYHLAASDAVARISGANLSADAVNPFNDDFDGETRGPVWSIGADQTQPNSVLAVSEID